MSGWISILPEAPFEFSVSCSSCSGVFGATVGAERHHTAPTTATRITSAPAPNQRRGACEFCVISFSGSWCIASPLLEGRTDRAFNRHTGQRLLSHRLGIRHLGVNEAPLLREHVEELHFTSGVADPPHAHTPFSRRNDRRL